MSKEHRNAFDLGLAVMRYAGLRTLGESESLRSEMLLDYITGVMESLNLKDVDKLLSSLDKTIAGIDADPNHKDLSLVYDYTIMIGKNLAAKANLYVGLLCELGCYMGSYNALLRKGANKHSIDRVISHIKPCVVQLNSFLPNKLGQLILRMCNDAKLVSPGTPEAEVIAREVADLYETIPQVLETLDEKRTDTRSDDVAVDASLDLFISHSSRDAVVAEALIELLLTACSIRDDRIRCTSVDGYRLSAGASTEAQLKSEVHDAKAFIGLITPSSIESAYVLFELGARWGAGLHIAPILACGADPSFLRGPLSGINALNCSYAAQMHQLVNDIAAVLQKQIAAPATYQRYIDKLVRLSKRKPKNSASRPNPRSK